MCRTRKNTLAGEPRSMSFPRRSKGTEASSSSFPFGTSANTSSMPASSSTDLTTGSSGMPSISSLSDYLPETCALYPFHEICAATNNFLAKRISSLGEGWRCNLRERDVVIFQRRFQGDPTILRCRLAAAGKIHHRNVVRLLGASLGGDCCYLVYEHVNGSSLADCLRNPRDSGYALFSSWVQRMQVAADLAQGLEYIHLYAAAGRSAPPGRVHNLISSSSVMVSHPQLRGMICHFGAFELAGETSTDGKNISSPDRARSPPRELRFEGRRGYIAPELLEGQSASQKTDIFAFGVVLLELLSGEEAVKYIYRKEKKDYARISLVDVARDLVCSEEDHSGGDEDQEAALAIRRRIRRWIDPRLMDSFPVETAERAVKLALDCVRVTPERRPGMDRVARKLSSFLLQARTWADNVRPPEDITLSLAPR